MVNNGVRSLLLEEKFYFRKLGLNFECRKKGIGSKFVTVGVEGNKYQAYQIQDDKIS